MNCEKIQGWLITDHLDQELDPKSHAEVNVHLKTCSVCREFSEAVCRSAVAPWKAAKSLEPDGIVWQRIEERILAETERSAGWFGELADLLAPFLRPPQLVFRTAFVLTLLVGVVFLMSWPGRYSDPTFAYLEEQSTFLHELQAGNTDLSNNDLPDYEAVLNGGNA